MHHPTDMIIHTTTHDTPVLEHWLERKKKKKEEEEEKKQTNKQTNKQTKQLKRFEAGLRVRSPPIPLSNEDAMSKFRAYATTDFMTSS